MKQAKCIRKIVFCFALFLLLPTSIRAIDSCPYQVQSRLKAIASNIKVDYSYVENDKGVIFKIRFTNLHPDIVIYDATTGNGYSYNDSKELFLDGYMPGKSYKFEMKASYDFGGMALGTDGSNAISSDCAKQVLYTTYVSLPSYNAYYKDELCNNLTNVPLCDKWYKHNLSYDEWKKEVGKQKTTVEKQKNKHKTEQKNWLEPLLDLFLRYYYIPIAIIVIIFGLFIYRKKKQEKIEGW